MLLSVTELQNCTVLGRDGAIGRVSDLYFDDASWIVRHLLVTAGAALDHREVLVPSPAAGEPDPVAHTLPVSLSIDHVRSSPDVGTARPVSRDRELLHLDHYGLPHYWGDTGFWGGGYFPGAKLTRSQFTETNRQYLREDEPCLRSCEAVLGFAVHATDGALGAIDGYVVETGTWAVRYLIIDAGSWWSGHLVLVEPSWVERMSGSAGTVMIDRPRDATRAAPPFASRIPLGRVGKVRHSA